MIFDDGLFPLTFHTVEVVQPMENKALAALGVFQQGIAVTKPIADSAASTNLGDAVPGQRAGVKEFAALLLQSAFGLAGQKQEPRVELFIGQRRLGSRSRVATLRRPPHFYRFPTVDKMRRIGRNERPSTPTGLKMVAVLSLAYSLFGSMSAAPRTTRFDLDFRSRCSVPCSVRSRAAGVCSAITFAKHFLQNRPSRVTAGF